MGAWRGLLQGIVSWWRGMRGIITRNCFLVEGMRGLLQGIVSWWRG